MSDLSIAQNPSPFDSIRRVDDQGQEYWSARELLKLMGYRKWQSFEVSIAEAVENLELNGDAVFEHFLQTTVKSQGRDAKDYRLTRYACYMVALACDGRKTEVAQAKKYFATKARQAELTQETVNIPKTYGEALLEAGRLALELEKVAAEKALIEQEKKKLEEKNELLEIENECITEDNQILSEAVDELFEYSSIIRIAKFNNVSEKLFKWQALKAASIRLGVEIKRVPCPRFVTKNLYSHDAWRAVYPNVNLPETLTLVVKNN